MTVFMLMLLGHFVSDYTLQGWLADAKQKSWWEKHAPHNLYRDDWIAGLFCHALYWAIITMLPLWLWAEYWWMAVAPNALIHALIDHAKCNCGKINLITDQYLHLAQIVMTIMIYKMTLG